MGFEPTVGLHLLRFSRPSQSTTLAPLLLEASSRHRHHFGHFFCGRLLRAAHLTDAGPEAELLGTFCGGRISRAERVTDVGLESPLAGTSRRSTLLLADLVDDVVGDEDRHVDGHGQRDRVARP